MSKLLPPFLSMLLSSAIALPATAASCRASASTKTARNVSAPAKWGAQALAARLSAAFMSGDSVSIELHARDGLLAEALPPEPLRPGWGNPTAKFDRIRDDIGGALSGIPPFASTAPRAPSIPIPPIRESAQTTRPAPTAESSRLNEIAERLSAYGLLPFRHGNPLIAGLAHAKLILEAANGAPFIQRRRALVRAFESLLSELAQATPAGWIVDRVASHGLSWWLVQNPSEDEQFKAHISIIDVGLDPSIKFFFDRRTLANHESTESGANWEYLGNTRIEYESSRFEKERYSGRNQAASLNRVIHVNFSDPPSPGEKHGRDFVHNWPAALVFVRTLTDQTQMREQFLRVIPKWVGRFGALPAGTPHIAHVLATLHAA